MKFHYIHSFLKRDSAKPQGLAIAGSEATHVNGKLAEGVQERNDEMVTKAL